MHSLTLRKGSWDVEFTTEKQFFPNAVDQNLTQQSPLEDTGRVNTMCLMKTVR